MVVYILAMLICKRRDFTQWTAMKIGVSLHL